MGLSTTFKLMLSLLNTRTLDLSTPQDSVNYTVTTSLVDGTAANQADKVFHDRRTLNAASSESLDLAGVLTDAFGNALTFAKVKAIIVYNRNSTTGNYLLVGGAAANALLGWVGDATDKIKVNPGGTFALMSPVDGHSVTAGTGDLLKVDNPGGSAIDYDIIIIGTSV